MIKQKPLALYWFMLQNLMLDLLSQSTPLSAWPDCKLAHNCVNNRVVSVRHRREFCVMHGLRPCISVSKPLLRCSFGEGGFWRERDIESEVRSN